MIGFMLNNRYKILDKLGDGGMAVVYKAEDTVLSRKVSIKMMKESLRDQEDLLEKFEKEAKAVASLSHPHIVNVYDVGHVDDFRYIVMEYIDGKTLKEHIEEKGKFSEQEVIRYSMQIADALDHAHISGVIHRDVKPQNILIDTSGNAKVTDFGIAIMNTTNTIISEKEMIGSVHYSSPEQIKGRLVDNRTDIYSLGILMFEMATGTLPFNDESPMTVAYRQVEEEIPKLTKLNKDISEGLESIIKKAVQKDRGNRYASMDELARDLRMIMIDPKIIVPSNNDYSKTSVLPNVFDEIFDSEEHRSFKEQSSEGGEFSKRFFAVFMALLLSMLTLSYYGYSVLADKLSSRSISVPNVEGLHYEDAVETLNDHSFYAEISSLEFNQLVEKGKVITQSKRPGIELKEGYTIRLIVSKGKEMIEVPDVRDVTLNEARVILENAKLQLGTTELVESELPKDHVISQVPLENTEVSLGTAINLVVSKGMEDKKVVMPDLTGKTYLEVLEITNALDLVVGSLDYDYSDSVEKDKVMTQSVSEGSEINKGSTVEIVISMGPLEVTDGTLVNQTFYIITEFEAEEAVIKVETVYEAEKTVVYEKSHRKEEGQVLVNFDVKVGSVVNVYFDDVLSKTTKVE